MPHACTAPFTVLTCLRAPPKAISALLTLNFPRLREFLEMYQNFPNVEKFPNGTKSSKMVFIMSPGAV